MKGNFCEFYEKKSGKKFDGKLSKVSEGFASVAEHFSMALL
jgi:hypothetical protein